MVNKVSKATPLSGVIIISPIIAGKLISTLKEVC